MYAARTSTRGGSIQRPPRIRPRIGTREALRFLMEAGHTLAGSLEYETTLQALADLAVPRVSCYCAVCIVEPGGRVRRMATARADSDTGPVSGRTATSRGEMPNDLYLERLPVTEEPMLVSPAEADGRREWARHHEVGELMRQLAATSLMLVPLVARESRLGLLVLASTRTDHRYYGPDDLDLARELGRIASLAIDNARMYRMAQDAIQARDQMLRVVAHDLRDPLNTVILGTEVVLDGLPAAERAREHRTLRSVSRSARRMDRLIQDLLDVARIEARHLSIEPAPESVAALLREAVEMHCGAAAELGIELHYREGEMLPEVTADHGRVLQVLGNLIGNALKFTPAGGRVELGAEMDGEGVRLWVADTGPGIDRELLPHLFDPYWQADRTDRRGLGLGLAIVRGLVEAHGGRVWAESRVDAGTRVSFTLPRVAASTGLGSTGDGAAPPPVPLQPGSAARPAQDGALRPIQPPGPRRSAWAARRPASSNREPSGDPDMLSLPMPIQAYFDANAELDAEGMLAPFAPDAIVRDERRTHRGADAVRTWIEEATLDVRAIATPQSIRSDGDSHLVTARVAGAFPGSPINLSFHFRLSESRIAELEIR